MSSKLTARDIDPKYRKFVYSQDYTSTKSIKGVKIVPLHSISSEEGDFSEIIRLNKGNLVQLPFFKVAQVNRTRLLPGAIKAWHLHYRQDYVWYVSPFHHLVAGLWDLRKDSKTMGTTMRIVLGSGVSSLLFIPHGIAQGSIVVCNEPVDLYIFSNVQFDLKNLDEHRLPWDSLGKDFWSPQRD